MIASAVHPRDEKDASARDIWSDAAKLSLRYGKRAKLRIQNVNRAELTIQKYACKRAFTRCAHIQRVRSLKCLLSEFLSHSSSDSGDLVIQLK